MREPKLGVAVGKKGIGKSYATEELMAKYVKGNASAKPRRVLILDVNDEYEFVKAIAISDIAVFSLHPKIEARRIRPYNADGTKMGLRDIADVLFMCLEHYRGGLLLIEDINKYVSDHLPNDVVGAICTNRHSDLDIIMHFQSIGRVTPKIWQNLNWIRFHKNSDSVERHQKKFQDKYEFLKIAEIMINEQYFEGNERFHLYVDLDKEHILGEYSPKMMKDAIDEFVAENYNKIIKPKLNRRDDYGKVISNPKKVTREVKDRYFKMYNGNLKRGYDGKR
tara:strand:+ start:3067 stop:3903 length:837 start_codon:yes stop_codon:yes gene_type:complete